MQIAGSRAGEFRHEALLYDGVEDFVAQVSAFLRAGAEAGEPALVVVSAAKARLLGDALGPAAEHVEFADMAEVGRNPARIIPAWRSFVDRHAGCDGPLRGVGEPIWPERSAAELVESQRHEALLNLAFAATPAWWLLCPYDVRSLPRPVIEHAYRTHPLVTDGESSRSALYEGLESFAKPFDAALPDAPPGAAVLPVAAGLLDRIRTVVSDRATSFGLSAHRACDLVLAVNELATNTIRHGGGTGTLRIWSEDGAIVCEVSDRGRIADPLAARSRPGTGQQGGLGLWLTNQLCDLIQIRTFAGGSAVRVHMRRD